MFKFGSPVMGDAFIDRTKHIPIFISYLDNNQHIMIKAPRRFGKTSLVKHIFEYKKKYEFIYIDIKRATSLKSLTTQILDKAYLLVGIEDFMRKSKKSLLGLGKSIRTIKLEHIGELTLELIEQDADEIELFLHSLDTVDKIAKKKNINIKFIFDEFQDILRFGNDLILEQLRSVTQHHENITYVFLGSIESIMTKIFQKKASPFFHFTEIIHLEGLDVDELYDYVCELFDKEFINYEQDSIKEMLYFLGGHPDYSIKVLSYLYLRTSRTKELVNKSLCLEALEHNILNTRPYLEELISKTKLKKHLFEVLSAIANETQIELTSSTLYNAHVDLEDMGLIKNVSRGKYKVVDIFLKVLLCQTNDEKLAIKDSLQIAY